MHPRTANEITYIDVPTGTDTVRLTTKEDLDKVANTKLYGQLRLATRDSAPSLYAQIRADTDGDGKAAFTWLTTRVTTSSLADAYAAQEVRDSWAKVPTPRYLLTSEWDAKLTNYDKLNKACGDFEVTGKQVVFAYYNMLPASFRAGHAILAQRTVNLRLPASIRRTRAYRARCCSTDWATSIHVSAALLSERF